MRRKLKYNEDQYINDYWNHIEQRVYLFYSTTYFDQMTALLTDIHTFLKYQKTSTKNSDETITEIETHF